MTTNELKCPVCGEGMEHFCGMPPYLTYHRCYNQDCPAYGRELSNERISEENAIIQSRIDKEKAAAVQEERRRTCLSMKRYNKILLAVQNKYEGEARWETALRYIQEMEEMVRVEQSEYNDSM